jgi:hypothetical protein
MPKERQENPDEWVAEARAYINSNILPRTEATQPLRDRMANGGHVNFAEVKKALGPDYDTVLGNVHGNEVIQITDQADPIRQLMKHKVDAIMNHLGKTPTDTLSREPYFQFLYQREVGKQVSRIKGSMVGDEYRMSTNELRNMEDQARRISLHETRTLLYDLAEESQFGQMVKHIMPFYNAWQEVLTRYAGIAMDNPVYLAQLYKAYKGIDEIGETYTDDYGNKVQRFRLPTWAKPLVNQGVFGSAIDDQGYIAFNKSSLNMLAAGTPGFGPIVNVAVSQAVTRGRPELEDSVKFMLPFGPTSGLGDTFLPAWAKRAVSSESEDRSYQAAVLAITRDKLTTAMLSGNPPDLQDPEVLAKWNKDVQDQAKSFFHLRTMAGLVSPVAPQWQSPYQDYIDEYRKMAREDPQNAERNFLDKYGEDYFALTQSLSKVYDGVPATVLAEKKRADYQALIEAYPEFGGLIIGSEGGGVGVQFSRAIYDKQFADAISDGNPQKRRASLSVNEVLTKPDVRLGWQKWSAFNDWKVNEMQRLGIKSMSEKKAEPLAAVQRVFIDKLAQGHPSWYEDFLDRDDTKWLRRMKAFDAIANTDNKQLADRPDIVGLREYMGIRKQVEAELAKRDAAGGSADLTAKANRDLLFAWDSLSNALIERRPAFASLASRWLTGDTVNRETWTSR